MLRFEEPVETDDGIYLFSSELLRYSCVAFVTIRSQLCEQPIVQPVCWLLNSPLIDEDATSMVSYPQPLKGLLVCLQGIHVSLPFAIAHWIYIYCWDYVGVL